MKQYVTLTIDGAQVRAVKGASVLDAAIEYGICIPHLCHVPNLSDIGACRICIVEHIKDGKAKVTTSCTLNVQEEHGDPQQFGKNKKAAAQYRRVTGRSGTELSCHSGRCCEVRG